MVSIFSCLQFVTLYVCYFSIYIFSKLILEFFSYFLYTYVQMIIIIKLRCLWLYIIIKYPIFERAIYEWNVWHLKMSRPRSCSIFYYESRFPLEDRNVKWNPFNGSRYNRYNQISQPRHMSITYTSNRVNCINIKYSGWHLKLWNPITRDKTNQCFLYKKGNVWISIPFGRRSRCIFFDGTISCNVWLRMSADSIWYCSESECFFLSIVSFSHISNKNQDTFILV